MKYNNIPRYVIVNFYALKNTTLDDFDQKEQGKDFWKEIFDDNLMTITFPITLIVLIISIPIYILFFLSVFEDSN